MTLFYVAVRDGGGGSAGVGKSHGKGHRRPVGSGGGDPLAVLVGEAGVEVWLGAEGAGLHVPGAVGLLVVGEPLHTAAVDRIGCWKAGGSQRDETLSGGIRRGLHRGKIGPAAVGLLRGDEFLHGFAGGGFVGASPAETGYAPAEIVVVAGVSRGEPGCGELDRAAILRGIGLGSVKLQCAHGEDGVADVAQAEGLASVGGWREPVARGSLPKQNVHGGSIG